MYSIKLHPKVDKFIKKLDNNLADKILSKFKLLKENPFLYLEHFEGNDYFKLRIGEYRALIDVDMSRCILFIRHLDNRSKIYKRI